MDYIFSQKELSYLDDIMPPFKHKKHDDLEKHQEIKDDDDDDDEISESTNKVTFLETIILRQKKGTLAIKK